MEVKKKGCVYFFKHVGQSSVKIGFSSNETPTNRFDQFKTYAPSGAEILGFIRTYKPLELETLLHAKHASKRLKGEWFEITRAEVEKEIAFYSDIADIEEMNNFQIEWMKHLDAKKAKPVFDGNVIEAVVRKIKTKKKFNVSELAKELNVSRQYVHKIMQNHTS